MARSWHYANRAVFGTAIAGLIILGIVACSTVLVPSDQASFSVPGTSLELLLRYYGGDRTIIGRSGDVEIVVPLAGEWGPQLRANIYLGGADTIGVIDFGGAYSFTLAPLTLQQRPLGMESWTYVGAFVRGRAGLAFISASELPECMDILMDEDRSVQPRGWMYKRDC